jgi:GAF domain-containing protein
LKGMDRSSQNPQKFRLLEGGAEDWRTPEEELKARVRYQEALAGLGKSALSEASSPDLLDEAARVVAEVLSVEYCKILELSPDGTELLLRAGAGWKEGYVGRVTVGANLESQAGYALISGGPVVVEDLTREDRFNGPWLLLEHGVVSGMSTIIYVNGHPYGVVGAHTQRKRQFNDEEIDFLKDVAELLGAAMERRQTEEIARSTIGERARAARRRLVFLAEANAILSTSMDYATTLETAARMAVPAIADWCFADVVEPGGLISRVTVAEDHSSKGELVRELHSRYSLDPSAPHGTPKVLRTGESELIPRPSEAVLGGIAPDAQHPEFLRLADAQSYICVPLQVRGRVMGALGLVTAESKRRYDQDDLILAEGLARCTALALDNARQQEKNVEVVRDLIQKVEEERRTASTAEPPEASTLTPRQSEVLNLLSEGKSAKEIANALKVSHETARNHIRAILRALGAHSQLEAVSRARALGVLE